VARDARPQGGSHGRECIRMRADMESVEELRSHVLGCVAEMGVSPEVAFKIELVLEELLTNIIQYAYPERKGDVQIEFFVLPEKKLHVTIRDWGSPFDPSVAEDPDTTQGLCERPIGGLGIFLVRHFASDLQYHRQSESNVISLCFQL
jgi:serine/threonine-protein kinase RsbW